MSIQGHIVELTRKHHVLETKLNEVKTHISHDDIEIKAIKLKKLKLKDELNKIRLH